MRLQSLRETLHFALQRTQWWFSYSKRGSRDHINSQVMQVRWHIFHFWRQIPQEQQIEVSLCPHCFAKFIIDYKDWVVDCVSQIIFTEFMCHAVLHHSTSLKSVQYCLQNPILLCIPSLFMKDFTLCCIPHKVCNDFVKHKGKRATVLHLYTILITGGVTYFCNEWSGVL